MLEILLFFFINLLGSFTAISNAIILRDIDGRRLGIDRVKPYQVFTLTTSLLCAFLVGLSFFQDNLQVILIELIPTSAFISLNIYTYFRLTKYKKRLLRRRRTA